MLQTEFMFMLPIIGFVGIILEGYGLNWANGENIEVAREMETLTTLSNPITTNDLECLSELPMEELLKIQKSLKEISNLTSSTTLTVPTTMPSSPSMFMVHDLDINRMGKDVHQSHGHVDMSDGYAFDFGGNDSVNALPFHNSKDKSGHDSHESHESTTYWVEESPSKVQKVLQVSLTALSFLAFGGYLLCMIVQAIKSKGTTYYHPALLPMTNIPQQTTTIKYRKRRPGRMKRNTNSTNRNGKIPSVAAPSPDDMFKFLVIAAEQYVKLNQI